MCNISKGGIGFEFLENRQLLSAAVVAYLPDYAYSSTLIAKIDYSALTQLNYFSVAASSKSGKLITKDPNTLVVSHLDKATAAAHKHGVKVSIVVGGAG